MGEGGVSKDIMAYTVFVTGNEKLLERILQENAQLDFEKIYRQKLFEAHKEKLERWGREMDADIIRQLDEASNDRR